MGSPVQINAFAEAMEGGIAPFALYTDPGLTLFVDFGGSGAVRGVFNVGTQMYAVVGETLYAVAGSGATTSIGLIYGSEPIIAATNRKPLTPQTVIVADGGAVYVLENGALISFPDPDLPGPVHSVAYLDGYIIFGITDGRFFISALNEATSVDALDFAEAEGSADKGVRVFVNGLELIYFGEDSVEIWQNTGNAAFPFERTGSGFLTVGCKAKLSPVHFDNSFVWVDNAGRVVSYQGGAARISNHAVEKDIQRTIDAQRANEIESFVYFEGGHEFLQISGPDWTWVRDAATKLWHRKQSYGIDRSLIRGYLRAGDRHIVGDSTAPKLYLMSMSAYDEAGGYLVTTVRSPPIAKPGNGIVWDTLYLEMQMGTGRGTSAHSATPEVMYRHSDDGGITWSKQRKRPLGAAGEFRGSMTFNALGASGVQGRTHEFSISAPVERCIVRAYADIRYCAPR
jgi:hypothetical protein